LESQRYLFLRISVTPLQIIKPFFGDQYFWASRVTDLGVGMGIRKLDADVLAGALTKITTDERMMARAKLIGEKISAEDGVTTAIAHIHRNVDYFKSRLSDRSDSDAPSGGFSPTCTLVWFVCKIITYAVEPKLSAVWRQSGDATGDKSASRSRQETTATATPIAKSLSGSSQDGTWTSKLAQLKQRASSQISSLLLSTGRASASDSDTPAPPTAQVAPIEAPLSPPYHDDSEIQTTTHNRKSFQRHRAYQSDVSPIFKQPESRTQRVLSKVGTLLPGSANRRNSADESISSGSSSSSNNNDVQ
jgi:hypothetical protein